MERTHKRHKRAARSLFDRRKVHKTPLSQSIQNPDPSSSSPTSTPCTDSSSIPENSIPVNWQVFSDEADTSYYNVEHTANHGTTIGLCITVHADNTWNVFACGKEVPETNPLLEGMPRCITSSTTAELLSIVERACICPGSPDKDFVDICAKRGGTMRGERGFGPVIAFVDKMAHQEGKMAGCTSLIILHNIPCKCRCNSAYYKLCHTY